MAFEVLISDPQMEEVKKALENEVFELFPSLNDVKKNCLDQIQKCIYGNTDRFKPFFDLLEKQARTLINDQFSNGQLEAKESLNKIIQRIKDILLSTASAEFNPEILNLPDNEVKRLILKSFKSKNGYKIPSLEETDYETPEELAKAIRAVQQRLIKESKRVIEMLSKGIVNMTRGRSMIYLSLENFLIQNAFISEFGMDPYNIWLTEDQRKELATFKNKDIFQRLEVIFLKQTYRVHRDIPPIFYMKEKDFSALEAMNLEEFKKFIKKEIIQNEDFRFYKPVGPKTKQTIIKWLRFFSDNKITVYPTFSQLTDVSEKIVPSTKNLIKKVEFFDKYPEIPFYIRHQILSSDKITVEMIEEKIKIFKNASIPKEYYGHYLLTDCPSGIKSPKIIAKIRRLYTFIDHVNLIVDYYERRKMLNQYKNLSARQEEEILKELKEKYSFIDTDKAWKRLIEIYPEVKNELPPKEHFKKKEIKNDFLQSPQKFLGIVERLKRENMMIHKENQELQIKLQKELEKRKSDIKRKKLLEEIRELEKKKDEQKSIIADLDEKISIRKGLVKEYKEQLAKVVNKIREIYRTEKETLDLAKSQKRDLNNEGSDPQTVKNKQLLETFIEDPELINVLAKDSYESIVLLKNFLKREPLDLSKLPMDFFNNYNLNDLLNILKKLKNKLENEGYYLSSEHLENLGGDEEDDKYD